MPKAGSRRPSDSTSIVAHCLASSMGSRKASDTTFMPNFRRRVRPASAAIVAMLSRIGARLTMRSACHSESTPPCSQRSTQRQKPAAEAKGNSDRPSPIDTVMSDCPALAPRGASARIFEPIGATNPTRGARGLQHRIGQQRRQCVGIGCLDQQELRRRFLDVPAIATLGRAHRGGFGNRWHRDAPRIRAACAADAMRSSSASKPRSPRSSLPAACWRASAHKISPSADASGCPLR